LGQALKHIPPSSDPRLLVGIDTSDDAAIFQLTDDLALVQTVDFFTPIVDDPYWFGRIAAANALSDVYAMGGTPLTALNIVGFPDKELEIDVLGEILRGGHEAVHEAGAVIVGGHSVSDPELKYGLAVTGTVHPREAITNTGARAGDLLLLTKPLGTGILCTALKRGALPDAELELVTRTMATLNRAASSAMRRLGAHGATDITGFGLLGHGLELARGSDVTLEIQASRVPLLPGVTAYAGAGFLTGGGRKNDEHVAPFTAWDPTIPPELRSVLVDPQTSGGLLIAVPAGEADRIDAVFAEEGVEVHAVIGRVVPKGAHLLRIVP
jgi:selenide,water dikinase